MNLRTIIELRLVLSGRYDIPGKVMIVSGRDAYGGRIHERIPAVDVERLNRDVEAYLEAARKAAEQQQEGAA